MIALRAQRFQLSLEGGVLLPQGQGELLVPLLQRAFLHVVLLHEPLLKAGDFRIHGGEGARLDVPHLVGHDLVDRVRLQL
eukprot:2645175-Prorocentrum_lima.AAC.1